MDRRLRSRTTASVIRLSPLRPARASTLACGSGCGCGCVGEHLARLRQPAFQLGSRYRAAVQVPLRLVATLAHQVVELRAFLDALGDRRQVEGVGETDDRRDERAALAVRRQSLDEGAVDLQGIDRQLGEPTEGGEAGAEIVDRDA